MIKILVAILVMWSSVVFAKAQSKRVAFTSSEVKLLIDSLNDSYWTKERLTSLFSDPRLKKMPGMVTIDVTKPVILKASQYAHFAEGPALNRARQFGAKHWEELEAAGKMFKVDPEIMLAIMLVETNLGTFTGRNPLMSVFSSVYVDSSALLTNGTKLTTKMKKRVKRKKGWALGELKALLKIRKKYSNDLYSLKGSYAGAMGICQFLPSSYVSYAKRKPGLAGAPDLFQAPDAIYSIASYLKGHGYKLGKFDRRNRKAIFAYNRSDVYVNIVLKIASRLNKNFAVVNTPPKKTTSH